MLEALGTPSADYQMLLAMMTELAHTGTLVIDDIEDRAQVRRGAEAIHLRYGIEVAINAANTVYFLPLLVLSNYPHLSDGQRLELFRIISGYSVRSHLGQGQDIYWSKFLSPESLRDWTADSMAQKLLQSYAHKTASLVEGTAEAACVIAKAHGDTRRACAAFGRVFGVAFQVLDDVLDFSQERLRQGTGGRDLAEGKPTYVVVRALERLNGTGRHRLRSILCQPELRNDARAHQEGVDLVRRSGALDACRSEAQTMVQDGWRRLSEHLPPSDAKSMLRVLCLALLGNGQE